MRDTKYAQELVSASRSFPDGSEARIERLHIKERSEDEIRFSWWIDGKFMPRPLNLSEDDLLALIREAIRLGVFSDRFLNELTTDLTAADRPSG